MLQDSTTGILHSSHVRTIQSFFKKSIIKKLLKGRTCLLEVISAYIIDDVKPI